MRRAIINGAVYMFMAIGEKLTENDLLPRNGVPDGRYVLWPRGKQWDVRYLAIGGGKRDWLVISDELFADQSSAWQAAFEHRTEIENKNYRMMEDVLKNLGGQKGYIDH